MWMQREWRDTIDRKGKGGVTINECIIALLVRGSWGVLDLDINYR